LAWSSPWHGSPFLQYAYGPDGTTWP